MEKAKVYAFPGAAPVRVESPAPESKAPRANEATGRGFFAGAFRVFLTLVVLLNRPLSWFFNGVAGFYFLAWIFQSGSAAMFSGLVWGAALVGGVLVKYIVLSWGGNLMRRKV